MLNDISIHAPLTRCDDSRAAEKMLVFVFQSTHLLRGATCNNQYKYNKRENFNPRTSYEVRLYIAANFL